MASEDGSRRSRSRLSSATGHALSETGWLDMHYEACRPEYEAMLRSVGIQQGWHVLDAGCGVGSFLPTMAELVGPSGEISALDLDPGNVEVARQRSTVIELARPLSVHIGSILDLPFPDNAFDALWCSNTLQYLTDDEVSVALTEFRRVVRPGGLVALKDADLSLMRISPTAPFLYQYLMDVGSRSDIPEAVQMRGVIRGPALCHALMRAGLTETRLRTWLIEMWHPLSPAQRQFWADGLEFWSSVAVRLPLPEPVQTMWRRLSDPNEIGAVLDHPELYADDVMVVAVGRVPVD
jgi:SAM-dependent methyltransferase